MFWGRLLPPAKLLASVDLCDMEMKPLNFYPIP